MRKFLLTLLILSAQALLFGQIGQQPKGTVFGTILDSATGLPRAGDSVYLVYVISTQIGTRGGTEYYNLAGAVSDQDGRVQFNDVPTSFSYLILSPAVPGYRATQASGYVRFDSTHRAETVLLIRPESTSGIGVSRPSTFPTLGWKRSGDSRLTVNHPSFPPGCRIRAYASTGALVGEAAIQAGSRATALAYTGGGTLFVGLIDGSGSPIAGFGIPAARHTADR